MGRWRLSQPVFTVLALVLGCAELALPLLRHAPNRLLSGQPLWLAELGWPGLILLVATVVLLSLGFIPRTKAGEHQAALLAMIVGLTLVLIFPLLAGHEAHILAEQSASSARTSIASGGWLIMIIGFLTLAEAARRRRLHPFGRLFLIALIICGFVLPAKLGFFDDLSLTKEWQAKSDVFNSALVQHLMIVGGTLIPTVIIGLPLGVLAYRRAALNEPLLAVLSLIQTIPSIALFALMMAPLTALGDAFPLLREIGIRGVGFAPAVIALTLYALLPIVRNTTEGLSSVSPAVIDAARGQGLTRRQNFFWVELPLAAPVILAGLRIVIVQTIGLAAVAALIGAGGLGSLMFQGLFSNAADLILLGVIPIVGLAVVSDLLFRGLTESLERRQG